MQLAKQSNLSKFNINRYEPGLFLVNEEAYHHSLLLASHFCQPWEPLRVNSIALDSWDALWEHQPELVIIGTGEHSLQLSPALLSPFMERKIRFEVMSTASACRTFHILAAEGRRVIAALCIL